MWLFGLLIAAIIIMALIGHLSLDADDKKYRQKIFDLTSKKIDREQKEFIENIKQIAYITTYENENITNNDIMIFFKEQCAFYLSKFHYYEYNYQIYDDNDKQNYAWTVEVTKDTNRTGGFNDADMYGIQFSFSNGFFTITMSSKPWSFNSPDHNLYSNSSIWISLQNCYKEIDNALSVCRHEAVIKWEVLGKKPVNSGKYSGAPLSFYTLSENKKSGETYTNKKSNSDSPVSDISSLLKYFGIDPENIDINLLKKNYHKMLSEYHPDKTARLGKDIRNLAEEKTKEIVDKYNILMRQLKGNERK
jgi:hypothetical protein